MSPARARRHSTTSDGQPTRTKNLDGDGAPPVDWTRVAAVLGQTPTGAPDTGGPNRPATVFALGTTEPYGATRFDLN